MAILWMLKCLKVLDGYWMNQTWKLMTKLCSVKFIQKIKRHPTSNRLIQALPLKILLLKTQHIKFPCSVDSTSVQLCCVLARYVRMNSTKNIVLLWKVLQKRSLNFVYQILCQSISMKLCHSTQVKVTELSVLQLKSSKIWLLKMSTRYLEKK